MRLKVFGGPTPSSCVFDAIAPTRKLRAQTSFLHLHGVSSCLAGRPLVAESRRSHAPRICDTSLNLYGSKSVWGILVPTHFRF